MHKILKENHTTQENMKKILFIGASFLSISFYGQNAKGAFQKAESEYYAKKYQEAAVDFDKAIELDPKNGAAHYYKGMCRIYLGDNKMAVEEFNYVLDLDPKNVDALINRGRSKYKTGDKEGACADWNRAKDLGDFDAKYELRNYCN